MELKTAFGMALRQIRLAKGLAQEDLMKAEISQSYLSQLEQGVRGASLAQTEKLASAMGVHPLMLLAKCYAIKGSEDASGLLHQIAVDLEEIG
ncbi:helix-turn-helix domain-containing protein [Pseudomonas aeruginosa]|uniref:helix-turn-helix domain-containing protein n=1 Tax=Pseudomonas aeruginosa TaxID=287 RepID=UPI0015721DC0|nr:helix-turn-helix transcriptional regulator [Pseudomonas aeruginosa]MCK1838883.1 helix-turn-helix transcriptional regulator [Pseudomonas aeruginosa]MCM8614344.1 helix-turn-helix transcriptional regulator [Pseudomonas aeruginosa]MCM8718521.1 helix-turn-helix transcriptional regulator [Pseudomonas aeruginosa]MCP2672123.1 helix-turn-helix transcriptional regulator [Pseudomonas aeruginosa]NTS89713.1 helix-turn-helix transcriptional regulator [Pseudomonas aeruginosa]